MQVSLRVSCRFCFGSESSEAMGALVTHSIQLENAACRLLLSIINNGTYVETGRSRVTNHKFGGKMNGSGTEEK
jgi:hypothetical protein